jgi:hypothetical protein
MNKENYESFLKMTNIFQKAIKNAQKKHKELGLPNVYSKNGNIIWELPDGTITKIKPENI